LQVLTAASGVDERRWCSEKINLENADIPAPSVGINYDAAAHHSPCMAMLPEAIGGQASSSCAEQPAFAIKTIRLILLLKQRLSIQWVCIFKCEISLLYRYSSLQLSCLVCFRSVGYSHWFYKLVRVKRTHISRLINLELSQNWERLMRYEPELFRG